LNSDFTKYNYDKYYEKFGHTKTSDILKIIDKKHDNNNYIVDNLVKYVGLENDFGIKMLKRTQESSFYSLRECAEDVIRAEKTEIFYNEYEKSGITDDLIEIEAEKELFNAFGDDYTSSELLKQEQLIKLLKDEPQIVYWIAKDSSCNKCKAIHNSRKPFIKEELENKKQLISHINCMCFYSYYPPKNDLKYKENSSSLLKKLFGKVNNAISNFFEKAEKVIKAYLESLTLSDIIHTSLDILGFIPVVGAVFDGANAIFYFSEGDYLNGSLSSIGAIPFIGWVSSGSKLIFKGAKVVDKAYDIAKTADKVSDIAKAADKISDISKALDKVSDISKAVDNVTDFSKTADKIKDVVQEIDKAKDFLKRADEIEDIVKAADDAVDISRSIEITNDIAESIDNINDVVKFVSDSGEIIDKIADSLKATEKYEKSQKALKEFTKIVSESLDSVKIIKPVWEGATLSEKVINAAKYFDKINDIVKEIKTAENIAKSIDVVKTAENIVDTFKTVEKVTDSIKETVKTVDNTIDSIKKIENIINTSEDAGELLKVADKITDTSKIAEKTTDVINNTEKMKDVVNNTVKAAENTSETAIISKSISKSDDIVKADGMLQNGKEIDIISEGNVRNSWQQSEIKGEKLNPDYARQKSFKDGNETIWGSKGSSRPDLYKEGKSIEIKNYDLSKNQNVNNLINNISRNYEKRLINLPKGTVQNVLIDITGQKINREIIQKIINRLSDKIDDGLLELIIKEL